MDKPGVVAGPAMDNPGVVAGPALDNPGVVAGPALDPWLRSALEEERDFCLRSLRDLDAERDAGDIDEADYETLRDSYTSRAAVVLRQLNGEVPAAELRRTRAGVGAGLAGDDLQSDHPDAGSGDGQGAGLDAGFDDGQDGGRDAGSGASSEPSSGDGRSLGRNAGRGGRRGGWRKRALISAGVAVVAAGAAWSVVASSATRLPGEEITGQDLGSEAATQSLQQAQSAADRGDDVTALKDYQKVLSAYPSQPEALTGEGWILAQTQQPALLQQGLTMLLSAEQAEPTYAPAHVYRGIALLSEGDYSDAIPELRWYLAHSPDPQLAPRVRTALQQALAKAASPSAPGTKNGG